MTHKKLAGLYAITCSPIHPSIQGVQALVLDVEQALRGGATIIQYRDKNPRTVAYQPIRDDIAHQLRALTRDYNALLIINDDAALARSSDADGVHLGKDDGSLTDARKMLRATAIIGVSCYNQYALAQQAVDNGADYIAFGRFFHSHTKPNAALANSELLTRAKQELRIPIVAIGGITPENGKILLEAGANMLAVVDGIFGQADILTASQAFRPFFTAP